MPITNLYAQWQYPDVGSDFPICVLMHGFGGSANDFDAATMKQIAQYGLFVLAVGMRGRNGASGSQDASGLEIYDIYDAVVYVRANFANKVSASHAGIVGYSGGGGNALAAACKFPDFWTMAVSHFGMSDYGRANPDGWYYNGGDHTTLESWIGGAPGTVPDNYYSRDATYALGTNYSGGYWYLFHDQQDVNVPVVHSQRAVTSMANAGRSNYTTNYTNTGDNPRWLHSLPGGGAQVTQTIPIWAPVLAAKTNAVWSVPASGSLKVIGYCKTKRFEITLGNRNDEVADVTYDTAADSYTLASQTGTMTATITQGAKTGSATFSGTTTITVT